MSARENIHPFRRWGVLVFDIFGLAILFVMAVAGGGLLAMIVYSIFTPENWILLGAFVVLSAFYAVFHLLWMGLFKGVDWAIGRPFERLGKRLESWSTVSPAGPRVQRFAKKVLVGGVLIGAIGIPLIGYIRSTFNI